MRARQHSVRNQSVNIDSALGKSYPAQQIIKKYRPLDETSLGGLHFMNTDGNNSGNNCGNNSGSSAPNPIDLEIMALQYEYAAQLPAKHSELKALLLTEHKEAARPPNADAMRLCHKIAGSGGTYGFKTITDACRYLENILQKNNAGSNILCATFTERWLAYFGACAETFNKLAKAAVTNQLHIQEWKLALTRADNALHKVWLSEQQALNLLLQKSINSDNPDTRKAA